MANIIFNTGALICEAPVVMNVYRNMSTTGNYVFNWTSKGDIYTGYGMNVQIKLFILHENTPPEIEYTAQSVPFNATNFSIGSYTDDQTSFRLEFSLDGGNTCYSSINIPYSSIIIT